MLGEGSFGIVYAGTLRGGATPRRVVLKRALAVEGGPQMLETEAYMNERVQADAPGVCARYLGSVLVGQEAARGKLVPGLWLLWDYQGSTTLSAYLRSPLYPQPLTQHLFGAAEAATLEEPEHAVAQEARARETGASRLPGAAAQPCCNPAPTRQPGR